MENNKLRKSILRDSFKAHACHIGSSLSCIDILVDIYSDMNKEDRFIFAKASGAAALYLILARDGIIPKNKVVHYLKNFPLVSKEVPGVIHGVGSLGHGLPVAAGLAFSDRTRKVYVLLGDAEVQCGTTWETILFARHHNLKNLKIYVDRNKLQALGNTEEILGIDKALILLKQLFPINVVQTIKGCGVPFMENKMEWHYLNLTPALLRKALEQLAYEEDIL